jgi:hypothetical protein
VREELTAAGIPTWMDVSAGNPFPLCLSVWPCRSGSVTPRALQNDCLVLTDA